MTRRIAEYLRIVRIIIEQRIVYVFALRTVHIEFVPLILLIVAGRRTQRRQFDSWNERRVRHFLIGRIETEIDPMRH